MHDATLCISLYIIGCTSCVLKSSEQETVNNRIIHSSTTSDERKTSICQPEETGVFLFCMLSGRVGDVCFSPVDDLMLSGRVDGHQGKSGLGLWLQVGMFLPVMR